MKSFATGLLGGILGALLVMGATVHAGTDGTLAGRTIQLVDAMGRRVMEMSKLQGDGAALFFFNDDGTAPLSAGLYEGGVPFVGLGNMPQVKALLRLAGRNKSGVLVFKDKQNRDRMILGLDLDNPEEEPFLVTFDRHGNKKVIFGRY